MRRSLLFAALAVAAASGAAAEALGALIAETTANRHGLTRPWFNQVEFDPARGRVTGMTLYGDVLYVQTSRGQVHAMDAERGDTLWVRRVGNPGHPTLPLGVNDEMVSVINGSTLFVINRYNGRIIWQTRLDGIPGAGVTMSQERVFIPMIDGMVAAYRLDPTAGRRYRDPETPADEEAAALVPDEADDEDAEEAEFARLDAFRVAEDTILPQIIQSYGSAIVPPLVTRQSASQEFVAWATDRGMMFVAELNRFRDRDFRINYRLRTHDIISASPTLIPSDPEAGIEAAKIIAVSHDGRVYALDERSGRELWQFPTGEPIRVPAVVIGDRIHVATSLGGMYCLEASSGRQLWWAPQITDFVAAGNDRIYVSDKLDRLVVLDAETGSRLDTLPVDPTHLRFRNDRTDRIYLASPSGLVQCLREVDLTEPLRHRPWGQVVEVEESEVTEAEREEAAPAVEQRPAEDPFQRPVAEPADHFDPFDDFDDFDDPFR